jgi:hypothetical protein
MAVIALITWLVTITGGSVMLGIWLARGGHRPGSGTRLAPGVLFTHLGLAAGGLLVWLVYVAVDSTPLAWVAFAMLLAVVTLGVTMVARWVPGRRAGVAESGFPAGVVVGHGLFATITLVLVLLSALGVGES